MANWKIETNVEKLLFFSHLRLQIMRVMEYRRRLTICFNNKFAEAVFCLFKKHKFIAFNAFSIYLLSLFSILMAGQKFPYLLHHSLDRTAFLYFLWCTTVFVFCIAVHYNIVMTSQNFIMNVPQQWQIWTEDDGEFLFCILVRFILINLAICEFVFYHMSSDK